MFTSQFNFTGASGVPLVPQAYTGTPFSFNTATFFGYKGWTNNTGIANSGAINFGPNSTYLPISLLQGDSVTFQLPGITKESITNFYFRGVSGDGVFILAY